MSFKRDGDDSAALSYQRKHRIAELLHGDIDDEEISKLSNGRYICKLCSHGPVFDTLAMFYVHKEGKKHKLSIQYAEQQKQELNDLIQKRKHEESMHDRTGYTDQESLPDRVSYSGGKKQRRKPYDRRTVVDIDSSRCSVNPHNHRTDTTPCSRLTTNTSSTSTKTFQSSLNESSCHSNKLACYNAPNSVSRTCHQPSNAQFKTTVKNNLYREKTNSDNTKIINVKNVQQFVGLSKTDQKNKYYLARKSNYANSDDNFKISERHSSHGGTQSVAPNQVWGYYKDYKPKHSASIKPASQSNRLAENTTETESANLEQSTPTTITEIKPDVCCNTTSPPVSKERAEQYLNAIRSGWKKDWDGKWIKDEGVEFDSDEEPPDAI